MTRLAKPSTSQLACQGKRWLCIELLLRLDLGHALSFEREKLGAARLARGESSPSSADSFSSPRPNCRRRGGLAVSSKRDGALVLHTLASWAFPPRLHALAVHPSLCPTLALCLQMTSTLFIVEHPGYSGKRGPTRAKYRASRPCLRPLVLLARPALFLVPCARAAVVSSSKAKHSYLPKHSRVWHTRGEVNPTATKPWCLGSLPKRVSLYYRVRHCGLRCPLTHAPQHAHPSQGQS